MGGGGGNDPQREKSWEEYRTRKEAAIAAGKPGLGKAFGKGDKSGGKSGGKSGKDGKGKGGKGKGKSDAKAAWDADAMRAAAATGQQPRFPRNAVGLDSWANVWMIHDKDPSTIFPDTLTLASGTCKCLRDVTVKGIPRVTVPWEDKGVNIDLFPEGFLWERGCSIV